MVTLNKTAGEVIAAALETDPSIHKNFTWLAALTDSFLGLVDSTLYQSSGIALNVEFVNSTYGLATDLPAVRQRRIPSARLPGMSHPAHCRRSNVS